MTPRPHHPHNTHCTAQATFVHKPINETTHIRLTALLLLRCSAFLHHSTQPVACPDEWARTQGSGLRDVRQLGGRAGGGGGANHSGCGTTHMSSESGAGCGFSHRPLFYAQSARAGGVVGRRPPVPQNHQTHTHTGARRRRLP
jgi:hypothetical protein